MGRPCSRELWYTFHWATEKKFEGQTLRLFNRGHLEGPRMMALLKMIGCTIWQFDSEGKQFRIDGHKGHFGGGLDGVVLGVPDSQVEAVSYGKEKPAAQGADEASWSKNRRVEFKY